MNYSTNRIVQIALFRSPDKKISCATGRHHLRMAIQKKQLFAVEHGATDMRLDEAFASVKGTALGYFSRNKLLRLR